MRHLKGLTSVFDLSPAEQSSSQVFTAKKKYGDTSEFVFTGAFIINFVRTL